MMTEPPPNAHDRWQVTAVMLGAADGSAEVQVSLVNDGWNALPPFSVHVTWSPGMEPRDVEAHALKIIGQSAGYLMDVLLAAAAAKQL